MVLMEKALSWTRHEVPLGLGHAASDHQGASEPGEFPYPLLDLPLGGGLHRAAEDHRGVGGSRLSHDGVAGPRQEALDHLGISQVRAAPIRLDVYPRQRLTLPLFLASAS